MALPPRGRAAGAGRAGILAGMPGPLAQVALAAAVACAPDAYDRALLALAARIESRPANRALAARVEAARVAFEREPDAARRALRAELDAAGLAIVRVPGLFYETYPQTGASLAAVDAWLGGGTAFVETGERAPVEEGAARVARALRTALPPDRRAVLVSASKGSADVRAALEGEPALGARAAAWIDLVGVLEGTPLADRARPTRAAVRELLSEAAADSLAREVRSARADASRFPAATRAYHVAAFPRAAEVGQRARAAFAALCPLGPNDGYVLLDAYERAPGAVLVLRGADHYLRVEGLLARLGALLRVALEDVGADARAAGEARAPPTRRCAARRGPGAS